MAFITLDASVMGYNKRPIVPLPLARTGAVTINHFVTSMTICCYYSLRVRA